MSTPHINELRKHLLDTLADLRNRETPMEPDRARAVAQVATVLVDSAKVEVEFLKATGQERAGFFEVQGEGALRIEQTTTGTVEEFPGVRRHKLR
jgi:hypothetical protein